MTEPTPAPAPENGKAKRSFPEVPISWILFTLILGICIMRVTGQMDREKFLAALGALLGGQQITLAAETRRRKANGG